VFYAVLTQVAAGPRIQAFEASEMLLTNTSPGIAADVSKRVHELYAQWMMAMGNTIEVLDCTYSSKFVQFHASWHPYATCTLVVKYICLASANAVFTAGIASPRRVMSE